MDYLISEVDMFRETVTNVLCESESLSQEFVKNLYSGVTNYWQDLVYSAIPNEHFFKQYMHYVVFTNLIKNMAELNNVRFKELLSNQKLPITKIASKENS